MSSVRWNTDSKRTRGTVVLNDVIVGRNTRPILWIDIVPYEDFFMLTIWGANLGKHKADHRGSYRSIRLAQRTAEAHVREVHRGYLREKLSRLDEKRARVAKALQYGTLISEKATAST